VGLSSIKSLIFRGHLVKIYNSTFSTKASNEFRSGFLPSRTVLLVNCFFSGSLANLQFLHIMCGFKPFCAIECKGIFAIQGGTLLAKLVCGKEQLKLIKYFFPLLT